MADDFDPTTAVLDEEFDASSAVPVEDDEPATPKKLGRVLDYDIRDLYDGERKFFQSRPDVAGMAAEDGRIILNPFSPLSETQKNAVARNEAFRLKMRDTGAKFDFQISPAQREFFKGTEYGSDEPMMKQTIVARILSGDRSAQATPEQLEAAEKFRAQVEPPSGDFDPSSAQEVVEQDVPRGTPRRSTAPQLAAALQANNLFGSATTALEGAWDKGIRRKPDGDWDLPIMDFQDPEAGLAKGLFQAGAGAFNTGLQKVGDRLDDAGPLTDKKAIQKVFHDFQQANNLSDEEVASAWSDLGNINRTWGEDEKVRVLSDGGILPNPTDSEWLDPAKAEQFIAGAQAPEEAKAAFRRNLPQIQTNLAAQKLGDYEAAATAVNTGRYPAMLVGLATQRITPPSEWAKEKGRTDLGSPQFIRDYEADVDPGFVQGLVGKLVTGQAKVANTLLGIAGLAGSDTAAEMAAAGTEGTAAVSRGLPNTGLAGSVVEEAPSVLAQVVTGRVLGAFGQTAATAGTYGAAGLQSVGLTYADEIAQGTPEPEAREKATKAGISTTIITSMFGTGAAGGVERVAAGQASEATIGSVLNAARQMGTKNLAKVPEFRKLATDVLKATAGEATEEGVDQLMQAFLTADPDKSLASAWNDAIEAAAVGGAIGGTVDVASKAVKSGLEPDAVIAAQKEATDLAMSALPEAPAAAKAALEPVEGNEPETAPQAEEETAQAGPKLVPDQLPDAPGTLAPDLTDEVLQQQEDPAEAVPSPDNVVAGEVEPVENLTTDETETPAPVSPDQVLPGDGALGPVDVPQPEAAAAQLGIGAQLDPLRNQTVPAEVSGEALRPRETASVEAAQESPVSPAVGDVSVQNGVPVTLDGYHGTEAEFSEFSDEASEYGGTFFYDSPEPAKFHGSRVVAAKVGLKNPKVLDAGEFDPVEWVDGRDHDDIRQAKAEGHDGVIVTGEGPRLIVTFDPSNTQIQNASGTAEGAPPAPSQVAETQTENPPVSVSPASESVTPTGLETQPQTLEDEVATESPEQLEQQARDIEAKAFEGQPPGIPPAEVPGYDGTPGPDYVSNMHAHIDAARERRGLPPLMSKPQLSDADAWDDALAAEQAYRNAHPEGGTAGNELFNTLVAQPPRALDKLEKALLLHELLVTEAAVDAAYHNLNHLPANASDEVRKKAQAAATAAQEYYDQLTTYIRAVGTASGISLQAQKMIVNRDYTLARVVNEWKGAKNAKSDKPVAWTSEDQKKAEKWFKDWQEAKQRVEDLEAANDQQAQLIKQLTADVEQAQAKAARHPPAVLKKIREKTSAAADAARARIEERRRNRQGPEDPETFVARAGLAPEDVADLKDYATILADKLVGATMDVTQATRWLISEAGDRFAEFGEWVFGEAQRIYRETAATVTGDAAPTPQEVADAIDPNEPLDRADVWSLARAHVIAGARGNEVLDNVTSDLQAVFPDVTREQVANEFTDYGKVAYPKPDEVNKELRRIKTIERIGLQLKDIRDGKMPKKTGAQRDDTDAQIRELEKQRREEMRALEDSMRAKGIPFEDNERRLKSALGAVKRRMENEIEEIQRAIDTNTKRTAPDRSPIALDTDAENLKKRLEEKRAEYNAIFKTEPDRLQQAKDSASRSIDRFLEMLVKGNTAVTKKEDVTPDAELEELRSLRDTFAKQVAESRKVRPTAEEIAQRERQAALESAEQTLAEIERRITEKDLAPKAKDDPKFADDPEIKAIRERIAEARKVLGEMRKEARPKKDPQQAKIERVEKYLDRAIAEEEQMLRDGILAKIKGTPVSTPAIEAKRQQLADMRQQRRDLYAAAHPETALDQAKKRVRDSIERLGDMIARNDVSVRQQKKVTPDDELAALIDAREALADQVKEMRRALPLTPEQQAAKEKAQLDAAQRTLDAIQQKLDSNDLAVKAPAGDGQVPHAVKLVRDQIKELNKQLDLRRKEAKVGPYSDEAREHRFLGSVEKKMQDLRRRMASNDFSKKPAAVPVNTAASREANLKLARLRAEYEAAKHKYILENAPAGTKALFYLKTVAAAQKLLTLGGDVGVILRNLGGATAQTIANDAAKLLPGEAGRKARARESQFIRMVKEGAKAFVSPARENDRFNTLMQRPNAGWDKTAGMHYASPFDTNTVNTEDLPAANLIERLPWWVWPAVAGVKVGLIASNPVLAAAVGMTALKGGLIVGLAGIQKPLLMAIDRAQRAMTNEARAMLFDLMLDNRPQGVTPDDAKAMAHSVMVATGRGGLKKLNGMMQGANVILLAPRYYLSRILTLLGQPLYSGPMSSTTRMQIAANYAKGASVRAGVIAMLALMFGKADDDDPEDTGVVLNPRSKDFLRVRINPTLKLDVMSGLNQFFNIGFRQITRTVQDQDTGRTHVMTARELSDDRRNFAAGKMNMLLRFGLETASGEYFGGKPVNMGTILDEATSMIVIDDLQKIYEQTDPATATAVAALLLAGANVTAGDFKQDKEKWAELRAEMEALRKEREDELNR